MSATRVRVQLAAVVFAVLLGQVLLYPGIDRLVVALGAKTSLDASMWFLLAEFGAFIVFAGLWGAASDAAGRRVPFIVAGALGGAIGYAALVVLPGLVNLTFRDVLLLRAAQGAATIGAFSLAMTTLMDLKGGHGRNMGAAGIAIGAGTALGAPLGGQLYELGAVVPLIIASGLFVAIAAIAATLPEPTIEPADRSVGRLLVSLRSTPALFLPFTFGFIDRLSAGFFALVGTFYFRTVFELDPGPTGLMLALFFAPFALLQYPFGILSDRIGRTVPIVAGSASYGIGVIAVGHAPTLELAAVAMVAVGVLGALMAPATMALVTDLARATERGIAMAGFNIFGSLGFLAGILVGGTAVDWYGYGPAFLLTGGLEVGLALVTVPIFLWLQVDRAVSFDD